MSIIGSRQLKFGAASLPRIDYNENPNIKGFEKVVDVFSKLFNERFSMEREFYKDTDTRYTDYIKQTIGFLTDKDALHKVRNKNLRKVKLWKEHVEMSPFYEGVAMTLKSMLIKKYFPSMDKAMNKGAIYSHYSLTVVCECVEYIMEFFQTYKMFVDVDKVLEHPNTIKWVKDYNEYLIVNKESINQEEKDRDTYRKKEMNYVDKMIEKLCKVKQ